MKDVLVRAKVSPVLKNEWFCGSCKKMRYEICEHILSIDSFKSTTTQRIYFIRPSDLKCSSKNVEYLFTCETCSKGDTGNTEDFRSRFNNYRCAHRNVLKRKKVKQESFNMSVKWLYFGIYLSSLFVSLSHNTYCNNGSYTYVYIFR